MNPVDYNVLPAPLWLITVLHLVTLTLHFVAMNFVLGGVVVMLLGRIKNKWQHPVVQRFVKLFPSAMAATITFGVAPLLFVQVVYHRQVYAASIVSGWFWLMIIAAVIVSYYLLYSAAFSSKTSGKAGWLGLSLIGLVYVAFVYTTVFSLVERPDVYTELYAANQSGLVLNPHVGEWIFRWLHMLLGAVTVGSFFVGWLGREHDEVYQVGKTFFLYTMVATMIVGFVYLFTLGEYLVPFMRTAGIWAVMVALVLSLGSLHFFFKKRFVPAGLMLVLSLAGMVLTRHELRLLLLEPVYEPSSMAVRPQWSVFVLFLVCFVVAIGALWYMLRLYFSGNRQTA